MNSLVSYNWLQDYVDLKGVTPEEFAKRISLSGPAVEKMYSGVGAQSNVPLDDKIVVGHVKEVTLHPNADALRIAVVDVGAQQAVPLQIVCGGSNLKQDQWVAVALVGARVKWHGEGDMVELQPIDIRGVKSEGMICAASEIGLGDVFPHAEREILDLELVGAPLAALTKPGMPLADLLGLSSDVVMDIEVTSNRVDAMGMVGMAREASAILKRRFLWKPPKLVGAHGDAPSGRSPQVGTRPAPTVSVKIAAKKQCPRYMAVRIDGVVVGESPWWLKRRLIAAGLRPINVLVDISNYVMLELAQPTHLFDADKVRGGIQVRMAKAGEKIRALDGKEYQLDDSILTIADDEQPIAIAGVIGGQATGVTDSTTSVMIECANFDPLTIRRGARKLNIQTDAQLRFEKGLSLGALPEALQRVVELVLDMAGGSIASKVSDVGITKYTAPRFSLSSDEVNALIGVSVSTREMKDVLQRLGFRVAFNGKKITAQVPWWRDHDIEDGRDLIEEIARVRGYANIPAIVPVGLAPRPVDAELIWEKQVRDVSKGAGLTEVYTYSFVSTDLLARAGYDARHMLHVQNPLSVEFEVMRTTLLPSMLQVASENRERFPEQRLFEVANVYYPTSLSFRPTNLRGAEASLRRDPSARGIARDDDKKEDWSDLPDEQLELGALFLGMSDSWRYAKGYVEHLLKDLGIVDISWRRLADDPFWHPGRSLQAFYQDELIATLGEISPTISNNFKLEGSVAMVDMPLEKIIPRARHARHYVQIAAFPEAKRDLAVVVDQQAEYADLAREIVGAIHELPLQVEWFDTYQGKNVPEGKKSVAMHLTFSSSERTLESSEVDRSMEKVMRVLQEKFGAEKRGA